ncbi:MAG: hypothetical protein OFPII_18420 [Osedax symbiont Rs1]|nr:MAG: hypothetical protein OFPII_18420 [Osedax symbiont Rs1]
MRDYLPPMQALKSFAAAARLSSVSKAAKELCVTQGAVSKQIKLLEAFLSVPLFIRSAKGICLTTEGQLYLPTVIKVLSELNNSGESLQRNPKQQQLLLDVIPSMSNIWLIPRIHSFEDRYPHLKVDLINGDGSPDFNLSQADICIRCLLPAAALANSIELFKERLILVGAPQLIEKTSIRQPTDILQHRLLLQNTRPLMWNNFLIDQQLSTEELNLGMGFQHFFMALKAAEEGLGLALIPDFLASQSIQQGKLVNPLALSIETDYGYYLISPSYKTQLRKTQEFISWLQQELIEP